VKRRFAGQRSAAVLNCPAQANIVRASALCRRGYFRFVPIQLAEGRPLAEQLGIYDVTDRCAPWPLPSSEVGAAPSIILDEEM
jgi:hypothetical protein